MGNSLSYFSTSEDYSFSENKFNTYIDIDIIPTVSKIK